MPDRAEDILARFPGPVELAPSRLKWALVLLGCAVFTAAGVWMTETGRGGYYGPAAIVFFGGGG